MALAWLLGRPGVTLGGRSAPAPTSSSPTTSPRPSCELGEDERARLDEVSAPPLLYPYWHQAKTASDRLSDADLALLGPHV